MPLPVISESTTIWEGQLFTGHGTVSLDTSDAAAFPITWAARSNGSNEITTPEELLAASHSACFSMAFSNTLAEAGFTADHIQATAAVTFEAGVGVTSSALTVEAKVPGLGEADFEQYAHAAKENCPISQALKGIEISITATLIA